MTFIVAGLDFGCQNYLFCFAEALLAVRRAVANGSSSGAWRFTERRVAVHKRPVSLFPSASDHWLTLLPN